MTLVVGLVLGVIYMLAVGSWTLWDAAFAASLASLGLLRYRTFVLPHPDARLTTHPLRSAVAVLRLLGLMAWLFLTGTLRVIRMSLGQSSEPGFVEVPLAPDSDASVALSAFLLTVSPDSFVVDVDRDRGILTVHVSDVRRAGEIREAHDRHYRRYVRPFFLRG